MSATVCLAANTSRYPDGGGFMWIYLNWALGLRSLGCDVIWLEDVFATDDIDRNVGTLRACLGRYGLADAIALCYPGGERVEHPAAAGCLTLEEATDADLLLNMAYDLSPDVVGRFRRSALLDIDPGLLQVWLSKGWISLAPHDLYFTIGETVGTPQARFPDGGLQWLHTPPAVALDWWDRAGPPPAGALLTTVSNWATYDEWLEDDDGYYSNDKRDGFLPFLDLPRVTSHAPELALSLDEYGPPTELIERGWRVREATTVASTPWDYRDYIRASLGEFSCVKPSCVRFQNAWISDRTICYLASGRPAVVQHTGPSRYLPDDAGLLRFRTLEEAAACLDSVVEEYERHSRLARELAETHFDAARNATRLLERALEVVPA